MRPDGRRKMKAQVAEVRRLLAAGSGHVHLVGIAGVGMAGLALHLAGRRFLVTGCDAAPNRISDWVISRGLRVLRGHDPLHIASHVEWIVRSAAVPETAPEIQAARRKKIPVFTRGTVLPALLDGRTSVAVSGTHGKTTTSAIIAQVLEGAGLRPGFCIGGEVTALGGVAGIGDDKIMVVEADESDGTVVLYEPDVAVITGIEFDHMEHFAGEDDLAACFEAFAGNARRRVIYCADDARAARVCAGLPKALSYGFSEAAAVRGSDLEEGAGSAAVTVTFRGKPLGRLKLPVPGRHNALNALAACGAALELGVPFERVQAALANFVSVRRRFEKVYNEHNLLVISDYAHHPTEIRALVQAALQLKRPRVLAVFQPHRYTRTKALGKDFPPAFSGLDGLVLVPVYEASEAPLAGGTSKDLLGHFEKDGGVPARHTGSLQEAWEYLKSMLKEGDVLLVIGAGDVEQVAFWARDEFRRRFAP